MKITPVYKPSGATSTSIVEEYKQKYQISSVMHAGALDPLAEGLLLLVTEYENQDDVLDLVNTTKSYEFEMVLGFRTDTYDLVGLVETVGIPGDISKCDLGQLANKIDTLQGEITQRVPVFSNMFHKNTWNFRHDLLQLDVDIIDESKKVAIFFANTRIR